MHPSRRRMHRKRILVTGSRSSSGNPRANGQRTGSERGQSMNIRHQCSLPESRPVSPLYVRHTYFWQAIIVKSS